MSQQSSSDANSVFDLPEEKYVHETKLTGHLDLINEQSCSLDDILLTSTILAENYLCHVLTKKSGGKILSTIFSRFSSAFDDILNRLPGGDVQNLQFIATTVQLQNLIEIIRCIDNVIRQIISVISCKRLPIQLQHISGITSHTITVLRKSYKHCKDSERIYGSFFKDASNVLSVLFQETYTIQKSFGFLLGKIKFSKKLDCCDETRQHAMEICEGLLDICCVISGMDNMLLVTAWKFLLGFLSEFMEIVEGRLTISSYVSLLCENIQDCVKYTIQLCAQSSHLFTSGDESTQKAFNRTCRFSAYFMSSLSSICEQFRCYFDDDVHTKIIALICEIFTYLQIANFPKQKIKEMNAGEKQFFIDLFSDIEKTLQKLLSQENFIKYFNNTHLHTSFPSSFIYILLSLCKTLISDSRSVEKWWSSDQTSIRNCAAISIMVTIIKLFPEANSSTNIWLYCFESNVIQIPTLHDVVVACLCAFVSTAPDSIYEHVEEIFIQNIFSFDPRKSLLASDVLAFICRSSKELCDQYFSMFCEIIRAENLTTQMSFSFIVILNFLRRISPYLSQECILRFENDKKQGLNFRLLQNTDKSDEIFLDNCKLVMKETCTCLEGKHRLSDLYKLGYSCDSLIQSLNLNQHINLKKKEVNKIVCLLSELSIFSSEFLTHFSNSLIASKFLFFLLKFNKVLGGDTILQNVVEILGNFSESVNWNNISVLCKMNIVGLLPKFENSCQQLLYRIFANSISDDNWRVRHVALNVFEIMSLTSNGTHLLEECAGLPKIAGRVETHLSFESVDASVSKKKIEELYKNFISEFLQNDCYEVSSVLQLDRSRKFIEKFANFNLIFRKDFILDGLRDLNATLDEFGILVANDDKLTSPLDCQVKSEFKISKTLFEKISKLLDY